MRKLAFPILAVAFAAGCHSTAVSREVEEDDALPTDGVTTEQNAAFEALEKNTNERWRWLQHPTHKTPLHLSAPREVEAARVVLLKNTDAAKTTLRVLRDNKALFKMRDPELELSSKKIEVDELGMTHARFQQMTHGVPVSGAELMAHYDRAGHLTSIDANYVPSLEDMDVQPTIASEDALAMVKNHILARTHVDEAILQPDEGKLVVWASLEDTAAPKRLAYEYRVNAVGAEHPAIWVTIVDAKTGTILSQYDNFQTIAGQGTGVLGDTKKFEVTQQGTGFILTDSSTATLIRTFTAQRQEINGNGVAVTSTNANTWDTGVTGAGAAVDAHFNAAAVFKYYKDKHARNALDGNGGPMLSTVHYGNQFDNAAWDGTRMIYGDGGQLFKPLSCGLDVVAHEFTHGVTEKTSNLIYQGQPGALNEAVSDIFGAFIEHAFAPDATKNWIMGENLVKQGSPLRNMMTPGAVNQPQPAHMTKLVQTQQDNGGVHINSGIINNAAFLMTVGGTNPVSKVEVKFGIGWEKAEKLWYRANTKYFITTTNFGQAAQGVLQAAKDVGLTDNETNIVDCAFKATGIAQGTCATLVDPKATTPQAPPTGDATSTPGSDGTTTGQTPGSAGGDGDDGDDETTTTRPKPKTRKRVVTETTGGCDQSGGSSNLGSSSLLVLGVVAVLSARRRRRS